MRNHNSQEPTDHSDHTAPQKQVLIIDPDLRTQQRLSRILASLGAKVIAYSSGLLALSHAEFPSISGIVMETQLPDINGIFLLTELQKRTNSPVIILSSEQDVETAVAAFKHNVFDFISKPSHNTLLKQRLERLLQYTPKRHKPAHAEPQRT